MAAEEGAVEELSVPLWRWWWWVDDMRSITHTNATTQMQKGRESCSKFDNMTKGKIFQRLQEI